MGRTLVGSLLLYVLISAPAYPAPPAVVVAKKPSLACPQTELGDAGLQARYATMWERYSADVDEATKKVGEEIGKQTKSATATGNLNLALFWRTLGKEFEQKGELRWDEPSLKKTWGDRFGDASFPTEFSVAVKKASEAYASARKNLEKGYGELVAEFTKAEKLEEALKVRGEIKELLAEKASAPEAAPAPKPDKPKQQVIRYHLAISETGEATVQISLAQQIDAKNERVDLGEGVWRRQHAFREQGDAKPLTGGFKRETEHVSVNSADKMLEMRPGQTKGYGSPIGSHIWYPVIFRPPVTFEVDLALADEGWELDLFPHLADLASERHTFFSLAVHDKRANKFRFYVREMNDRKSRDLFNAVIDLDNPLKKSFRLPVPNAKSQEPYLFQISCGPNTPETMGSQGGSLACGIHRLQFTGKPCPIYGMRLAEQPGRVFVQEVVKASSAERAGIQEGDVVIAVDAKPVADRNGATAVLRSHTCGQPCAVKVLRGDVQKTIMMDWELP